MTMKIASMFRFLYLQVMRDPEFWEGEEFFEWEPHDEDGVISVKDQGRHSTFEVPNDPWPTPDPCTSIKLKLNCPIEGKYMFRLISLDIFPCVKLNDWWPEEASCLRGQMMLEGCHLMFIDPRLKYPWVPFSDTFARISFAPADSRIIKECSAVARAVYMVGKLLIYDKPDLTYTYVCSHL